MAAILIVNFGGPRSLEEIEPFLKTLLTDPDVISTPFPTFLQNLFFRRVAKKRAPRIAHDYVQIGGKSPIYGDTEAVASEVQNLLKKEVFTFHRYLPATYQKTLTQLETFRGEKIDVFPMFPQFSYSTTGSIAKFFKKHLTPSTERKLFWIKSYPKHPAFVALFQEKIGLFLEEKKITHEDLLLLFSAHGLPQLFVDRGDPYLEECRSSFKAIMQAFPKVKGVLCFQSKFGRGEWIKPYTQEVCEAMEKWNEGRRHTLFVPLSFTSDHIETLFEVEKLYLPIIDSKGYKAYRLPAFNRCPRWIQVIITIINSSFSR